MKYMLQIRFNDARAELTKLSDDQQQAVFAEYMAISRAPGVLDGNQLQPMDTATIVTVHDGETHTTHQPVDRTGLDGYYLYEAEDLDSAIELAARVPAARMGGTVEIRATVER
jgi:hypothetical protein